MRRAANSQVFNILLLLLLLLTHHTQWVRCCAWQKKFHELFNPPINQLMRLIDEEAANECIDHYWPTQHGPRLIFSILAEIEHMGVSLAQQLYQRSNLCQRKTAAYRVVKKRLKSSLRKYVEAVQNPFFRQLEWMYRIKIAELIASVGQLHLPCAVRMILFHDAGMRRLLDENKSKEDREEEKKRDNEKATGSEEEGQEMGKKENKNEVGCVEGLRSRVLQHAIFLGFPGLYYGRKKHRFNGTTHAVDNQPDKIDMFNYFIGSLPFFVTHSDDVPTLTSSIKKH